MISQNSLSFTQNISFGELYNTYKISKSNAVSVNAQKILKTAVDLDFNFFKKILKNIEYFQISIGFFQFNIEKKF